MQMTNNVLNALSVPQLKRALEIKQRIAALEEELGQILGSSPEFPAAMNRPGKRRMSAAAKAKIAATQRARWAKVRKAAAVKKAAPPASRRLSESARARISAAAKARWAKYRADKKSSG